jgi:hypothetical protein
MVDVVNNRCLAQGCTYAPCYNTAVSHTHTQHTFARAQPLSLTIVAPHVVHWHKWPDACNARCRRHCISSLFATPRAALFCRQPTSVALLLYLTLLRNRVHALVCLQNDKRPRWCAAHTTAIMVDVTARRCTAAGCSKVRNESSRQRRTSRDETAMVKLRWLSPIVLWCFPILTMCSTSVLSLFVTF